MGTAEEMEAGRKDLANLGISGTHARSEPAGEDTGGTPRKDDGTTNVIPFGPTGNTAAQDRGGTGLTEKLGSTGGNTGPTGTQPTASQAKQSGTSPSLDFLDDFFGPNKRHLVAIRKNKDTKPDIKARHFEASDRDGQQKFITDWGADGFDLYFSPNPIKGTRHKKATKSDVAEATHLWIDLDPRPGEPLDAERAAMLALLTTNLPQGVPQPNRIVDSGRGFWGYWRLTAPQPVDGSKNNVNGPLTDTVERYGRGIEQAFGERFADGCRNIDRIARLPGTINTKTGRQAHVLHEFSHDERHDIECFPRSVTKPNDQEAPKGKKLSPSGKYEPINPSDPALEKISLRWSHANYAAEYAGDRSRAAFGFVCECKRAGIAENVITRCLMHWPIGACLREKPNVDRELIRILARGDEFSIDPKLAEMNEKHHVVLHGGKTRVLTWDDDEIYAGRKVPVYQTPEDFKAFHSKYRHTYQIKAKIKDEKGNETGETETKTVTRALGSWWWDQKERRQYEGLTYAPNSDVGIVGGKLNLWTGFTVAPRKGRGHVGYLKHLRDNICAGNRKHYDYLIQMMARAVQHPELRGEIGIVFIGRKGTGKNVAVEEFGKLFGTHFWTVTNPEHFTGKFNSHLQHCSILLADECLKPENKVHEQIAKTLVTGQTIVIEPKGVNAYQVKNFLHVFICTNSRWAIPATADERRWFILNVGEKHIKDYPYFKKICDDMEASGRANLLNYLLNLDISQFEFRDVPETDALVEQQERTRKGVDLLVEEWCHEGHLPFSHPNKPHVIVTSGSEAPIPSGFDNFIRTKAPGDLRQLGPTRIKTVLTNEWGTSRFHGRIHGQLVSGIEVPPLAVLRKTFETRCNGGKQITWPAGNEWAASYDDDGSPRQTAEDVGGPTESDVAFDEHRKSDGVFAEALALEAPGGAVKPSRNPSMS